MNIRRAPCSFKYIIAEAGAKLRWGWESGDPLGSPPERPEVLAERRRRPRPALGHGLASGDVHLYEPTDVKAV